MNKLKHETTICRLMAPSVLIDLTDEEADKLIADGILMEYRGWRTFTRKGFRQFVDQGRCTWRDDGEGIEITFHYRRSGSGFLSTVCEFLARRIHWLFRW